MEASHPEKHLQKHCQTHHPSQGYTQPVTEARGHEELVPLSFDIRGPGLTCDYQTIELCNLPEVIWTFSKCGGGGESGTKLPMSAERGGVNRQ